MSEEASNAPTAVPTAIVASLCFAVVMGLGASLQQLLLKQAVDCSMDHRRESRSRFQHGNRHRSYHGQSYRSTDGHSAFGYHVPYTK